METIEFRDDDVVTAAPAVVEHLVEEEGDGEMEVEEAPAPVAAAAPVVAPVPEQPAVEDEDLGIKIRKDYVPQVGFLGVKWMACLHPGVRSAWRAWRACVAASDVFVCCGHAMCSP